MLLLLVSTVIYTTSDIQFKKKLQDIKKGKKYLRTSGFMGVFLPNL